MKHGEDAVHLFKGLFVIVMFDRKLHRMTLITDRYGFRPLFYVRRQNTLLFASELKALCISDPHPRQMDDVGTLEFFCYGSYVMDRTWIKGYQRLSPATIMTIDHKGTRLNKYWEYRFDEKAPKLDQPTYFTVFGKLLDRAVERSMKGSHRIGIFLSGGYDSRSIAASIREYHLPLPAFTFGYQESRDVRYAGLLAKRIGLDHYLLNDKGPYLLKNCRAIVWRTEGLSQFSSCTSIRYHSILKKKIDIILAGFLGEFSGSHVWPELLLVKSRQAAIKTIFKRMLGNRLESISYIFKPAFFKDTFDHMRTRFEESFEEIRNDHPMDIADCWNFVKFHPLSTWHTPSVDRHLFEVRAPHMDFDLVNFLLTIPPYSRLEQRVYKKMIAYSFPEISDVPCTNSGLPINPSFMTEYVAMAIRYLVRKLTSPFAKLILSEAPLGRDFSNLGEEFRAEPELFEYVIKPLLDGEVFPSHVFDRKGIEDIVTQHYEKKRNHEAIIATLISWGVAAKYFLHDDLSDVPTDIFRP